METKLSETIELQAKDGHRFAAYKATPRDPARGAVVIVQEIFGVTEHIRQVCDDYADRGYVALSPHLYDRHGRGIALTYDEADTQRGIQLARALTLGTALTDIQATIDEAARFGKVGCIGFCYGGTLTWLAAASADNMACASSYYGGHVAALVDRKPRVPTILHFGERDHMVPPADVEKIRRAPPDLPIYAYAADHGFDSKPRESYDAAASALARARTLALFAEHLG